MAKVGVAVLLQSPREPHGADTRHARKTVANGWILTERMPARPDQGGVEFGNTVFQ